MVKTTDSPVVGGEVKKEEEAEMEEEVGKGVCRCYRWLEQKVRSH